MAKDNKYQNVYLSKGLIEQYLIEGYKKYISESCKHEKEEHNNGHQVNYSITDTDNNVYKVNVFFKTNGSTTLQYSTGTPYTGIQEQICENIYINTLITENANNYPTFILNDLDHFSTIKEYFKKNYTEEFNTLEETPSTKKYQINKPYFGKFTLSFYPTTRRLTLQGVPSSMIIEALLLIKDLGYNIDTEIRKFNQFHNVHIDDNEIKKEIELYIPNFYSLQQSTRKAIEDSIRISKVKVLSMNNYAYVFREAYIALEGIIIDKLHKMHDDTFYDNLIGDKKREYRFRRWSYYFQQDGKLTENARSEMKNKCKECHPCKLEEAYTFYKENRHCHSHSDYIYRSGTIEQTVEPSYVSALKKLHKSILTISELHDTMLTL